MRIPGIGDLTPSGVLQLVVARSGNRWMVAGAFALLVMRVLRRRVHGQRRRVRIDLRDGSRYEIGVTQGS